MAAALELPISRDDRNQGWVAPDAKFTAPLGPRVFVPRPRLEKLFGDPRTHGARVTISAAPVGSGKTSTLADVARNLPPGTAAWCTLDRHDNDPFVFGCSVLEAILAAESEQPDDAWLPAASPTRDPLEQAVQLAANGAGMLLVLDHVEDLRVNAIGGTVARLVHMLPSSLSVVLLAQQDPDLPTRLRASTDVREVRVADFAFTLDEARALFDGHGVALDDDELDTIVEWTRGSAAALKLAAGAMHLGCPAGVLVDEARNGDGVVHDALLGHVLAHMSDDARRFVLDLSIVDQFDLGLAAAVSDQNVASTTRVLEPIVDTDLFLDPVSDRPGWYEHHPLFADLLRITLRHERPGETPGLYANASRWLAEHALPGEALECAIEAGDWDLIVPLVLEQWCDTMLDGMPRPLDRVPDLPAEVSHRDAAGAMAAAALHLARGRAASSDAPPLRYDAESLPPGQRLVHDLLDYELARRGPSPVALETAADALFRWSLQHGEPARSSRVAGLAARARAEARLMSGDLAGAGDLLEDAILFATANGDEQMTAMATASLALVTALSGRLRRAIALTDELGETWVISRSPTVQGTRALTFATCAYHADRLPAAQEALVEARALLHGGAAADTILPVVRARIATSLGDVGTAERMLGRAAASSRPALLAVLRDAFGLVTNGRGGPAPGATTGPSVAHPYALALEDVATANTLLAQGDGRRADEALDRAFAIVARHGYRRLFVDCGLAVGPLLRHYVASAHPFRLMASQQLERLQSDDPGEQRGVVEMLTERELTVLRYLPTMLSNREIAAEMYFSVNTVKTHLKSIYRKLDVTKRRDAVDRARTLSII